MVHKYVQQLLVKRVMAGERGQEEEANREAGLEKLRQNQINFFYITEMGRKDSQMYSIPIDHYRKQIGKQYKKQTSTNVREMKKHSESKSSSYKVHQDVRMVISGFAVVVVVLYCILFLWLFDHKPAK